MYKSETSSTDSKKSTESVDELDISGLNLTRYRRSRPRFPFPVTPRQCKSDNNTSCTSCYSDCSASDTEVITNRRRYRKRRPLPPIGIFWDIENCHVPKSKCASTLVQRIRDLFTANYREVEFIVVCDVFKENPQVIQDLHDTQVNTIHVQSTSKNAADEKLRQSLRKFADIYHPPAAVALITSDFNYAGDLCDLRYRRKIHVILIHNTNVADALIACANETHLFSEIAGNLPITRKEKQTPNTGSDLLICNLPLNCDPRKIKSRLKFLTDNCGGRVINVISEKGIATVRFSTADFAIRAERRIQGEDVFGSKIHVVNPSSQLKNADKPHTSRQNSSSIPKTNSQAPGALQETRGHSDSPTLLSLKLLGIQLQQLIRDSGLPCVLLDELPNLYLTAYGSKLRPERYNCTSLSTLIEKLRNYIHVIPGAVVVLAKTEVSPIVIRVWTILNKVPYKMSIDTFVYEYQYRYKCYIPMNTLEKLGEVVMVKSTMICLRGIYVLAAEIYDLLQLSGGELISANLAATYKNHFKKDLYFAISMEYFMDRFSWLFVLKPTKKSTKLILNSNFSERSWNVPTDIKTNEAEAIQMPSVICTKSVSDAVAVDTQSSAERDFDETPFVFPTGVMMPKIEAPEPKELPLPHKLLEKYQGSS